MLRIRSCAWALAVCLLGLPVTAAAETFRGTLNIIWGDPKNSSSHPGDVIYLLATADGRYLPLDVPGGVNSALPFNGKPVVATGQVGSPRSSAKSATGAAGANMIVVESFTLDAPAATPAFASGPQGEPPVTGVRKVLFLLLRFQDDGADPHPGSFFDALTNPDTGSPGLGIPATINGFFKKTSNNTFSWDGDTGGVGGVGSTTWITLPHPKNYYAPCGWSGACFASPPYTNFNNFNNDAVTAATNEGIVLTPYDNINFVVSNDLDCCAWGGNLTIAGKTYGTTWEPAWSQETRVYSHELGHSLGLPHSGWVYFAYDSPWDVMSRESDLNHTACGSYFSRNRVPTPGVDTIYCAEPGNGYIMPHRDFLGWIPGANQVTVPVYTSASVALEGAALAVGGAKKMIKICIPGWPCTTGVTGSRYFTVEARVKGGTAATQYDNGIPNEGVIIHDVWFGRPSVVAGAGTCYFNDQSGWAVPVDATPGDFGPSCAWTTGQALYNAQFTPGMTYTDTTFKFKVNVVSRVGNTFNITVQAAVVSTGDFDGDARADMTIYRNSTGDWMALKSSNNFTSATILRWGTGPTWTPVNGDFDGDGRLDPAVYQPSTGRWMAYKSSTNFTSWLDVTWGGGPDYQPVPGDYDGDGKTDPALYKKTTGQWLVALSSTNYTTPLNVTWGGMSHTAVPGRDFDGDGKSDIVTYRDSTGTWHILKSSSNFTTSLTLVWGGPDNTLVPGDYDGDGIADAGLYNRASGVWSILKSSTNFTTSLIVTYGTPAFDPVPGDFDGDGKFDLGAFERATNNWYVLKSSTNYTTTFNVQGWGIAGDVRFPGVIVPDRSSETRRLSDFDGDGLSDLTTYVASTAAWQSLTSSTGHNSSLTRFRGGSSWMPAPGDFDGDGKTDYGVYNSGTGGWNVLLSAANYSTAIVKTFGGSPYVPIAGDFDGDGKSDIAVHNPSSGHWMWLTSSSNFTAIGAVNFGGAGYTQTPGDFDGDGRTDAAVYSQATGNWYVLFAATNFTTFMSMNVGGPGSVPVQGDYDNDGKTDFAAYNTTSGLWSILKSSTGYTAFTATWGGTGWTPARGDWDGDGKLDLGLFVPSIGYWNVLLSGTNFSTSLVRTMGGPSTGVPLFP